MAEVGQVWFFVESGAQVGPMTLAALQDAQRSGRVRPETLVWRAGMAGWQPAQAVPEVAAGFVAAPPPTPSAPPAAPAPTASAPVWAPPAQAQAPSPTAAPSYGAPGGYAAQATPGGPMALPRIPTGEAIGIGVVTLGIYTLVKFYQAGKAYLGLTPGRPSSFDTLFWTYLGLAIGGGIMSLVFAPIGILAALASIVVGALLLSEVLKARAEVLRRARLSLPQLTSDGAHMALWICGVIIPCIGLVLLITQAVFFFNDHNMIADALAHTGAPRHAGHGGHPGHAFGGTAPAPAAALPGARCPSCGQALPEGARFCGACGRATA